jgi:hypothetical protein
MVAVLLGSAGVSRSADYQKGIAAYESGDYASALREWMPLAEGGDAYAQTILGVMYDEGQGVRQDYKTAVKWYKLAAEQGDALAQGNLGAMYAFGRSVLKDYLYAHMWSNIAATNGHDLDAKLREHFEKNMTSGQIIEAERLARECVRKKYKECIKKSSKLNEVFKRLPKKGYSLFSAGLTENKSKNYDTKLSGLVVSLEDNGFLLDSGFGKFRIRLTEDTYEPMKGDDVTVIGNTNELYAMNSIVFANKVLLNGRKLKSGSLIKRNISDGWVSINGRVLSIVGDILHLESDKKITISLKSVKFTPPLQVGSLVSINGYSTKDNNGDLFVRAKNIIQLSR